MPDGPSAPASTRRGAPSEGRSPSRVGSRTGSALRATAARAALWLLLGGQVGAWVLFGAVVAPVAFRVLPSTGLAGTLVGPVLACLHLYGAAAGVALAGLALGLRRGTTCVVLPLAMSAACLFSHFGVTASIDEIRDLAFGPDGTPEIAARFRRLHQISVTLYLGVGLGALALVGLHARADARAAGWNGGTPGGVRADETGRRAGKDKGNFSQERVAVG